MLWNYSSESTMDIQKMDKSRTRTLPQSPSLRRPCLPSPSPRSETLCRVAISAADAFLLLFCFHFAPRLASPTDLFLNFSRSAFDLVLASSAAERWRKIRIRKIPSCQLLSAGKGALSQFRTTVSTFRFLCTTSWLNGG